ncbi:hypothetical protein [Lysinibacillus antri]|uniref:Uncharacterized protein n=1 Tax=Lysinibacillus antri TaxID=2498145 RepID=A0A432LHK8_9BACI|nr:hypothetical protein [Lysinibacillus antri]RUL56483.1 hypothetical protein EK386_02295 [Lysinibacillus antri]
MKKVALLIVLLIVSVILIACEFQEQEIYYNGQLRPVSQIEEIIADTLEVENPDMDLEISIYEEEEDD